MATVTPNFNWPVPTSTDLVKDGATAIEALGDSIDASLLDLKGGTTGQVLSKTSATDMDFTWTSPNPGDITGVTAGTGISGGGTSGDVTVTNSMATAIDAKGDLVPGTGADTFARLAVGANHLVLTADSAEATGLKWTGGWISYTPTWTATTTNPVIGNGSIVGGYRRIGDIVEFYAKIVAGSTTTYGSGSYRVSLPVTAFGSEWVQGFTVGILDSGVAWYTNYYGQGQRSGLSSSFEANLMSNQADWTNTSPFTFGNGDTFQVQGRYRVA
jgi:hypothetical protein